jgi:hypothetical protein
MMKAGAGVTGPLIIAVPQRERSDSGKTRVTHDGSSINRFIFGGSSRERASLGGAIHTWFFLRL